MEDEARNVYREVKDRHVLRTADVYQTEIEDGVTGYSDTLLSVVANFRNGGAPEGFNAQSMAGKSKRGEVALRLFAVIDPETEKFVRVGFKARGCLAVTGCARVVCSMLEGRTFDEALAITTDDVKTALDGVPVDKMYTLHFAVEAIRALIGDYLAHRGATLEELDAIVPCNAMGVPCIICEHCSFRSTRVDLKMAEA